MHNLTIKLQVQGQGRVDDDYINNARRYIVFVSSSPCTVTMLSYALSCLILLRTHALGTRYELYNIN